MLNFLATESPNAGGKEDILDRDIASKKSLRNIEEDRSALSEKWAILTALQVEDFIQALRGNRG